MGAMRIYLSRWVSLDVESNLRRMRQESDEAAGSGAALCVFPEAFLHGYTRRLDPSRAREAFRETSRAHPATAFLFGSLTEDRRNRATVWLGGDEIARYDKVHLFEPNDESRLWDRGDRYVAVRAAGRTIGVMTCNDVRFPEQARALRLQAGADLIVDVAWWPWRRDEVWAALLRARAIENAVWVAGCCIAASEVPDERFAGAGNHVFDPVGEPVRSPDDRVYDLDPARERGVIVDPLGTWVGIDRIEVAGESRPA